MANHPLTILFFGRPGAGKGTQMRLLKERLEGKNAGTVIPFEWASLIRTYTEGNSKIQRQAREVLEKGERLPLFLAPTLWLPVFESMPEQAHLLVDGVPRHKTEADLFDSLLAFYRDGQVEVINLEVPETVSQSRLTDRGKVERRADDLTPESIQKRLDWFLTDTLPLLDFFKKSPLYRVHDIDGTQDRDAIAEAIERAALS